MKKITRVLFAAAAICTGCSTTYNIHLNDSTVITSKGQPKLDQQRNLWIFIDAAGRTNAVRAGRVVEVVPQSMDAKRF